MKTSFNLFGHRATARAQGALITSGQGCPVRPMHPHRTGVISKAVDILDATTLHESAAALAAHLPLLYEPVALPCSMMKCGDAIYRSTLDPVLRGEDNGPDWRFIAVLVTASAYLFVPPGPLPALIDTYLTSSLYRKKSKVYSKDDIRFGRQLATGGFGTVYKAELKQEDGSYTPVVVKKAKEYGEAEVWMNERMDRIGGGSCAGFVTAFDESSASVGSPLDKAIWLIWQYEGDSTLFNMMEKREFPYNLEAELFNRELRLPKGPRRMMTTIKLAMKQLLEALAVCHNTGIVHRDVKPQNCIISTLDKKIKLIDLGAAADLRVGINYVPKEYLLDPRYAPPQQYIMSTQTVRPPPVPVAALLSPVLWRMEQPDRFDMYSCGVTMLQMIFPKFRSDNTLIAFRRQLQDKYKWDLREWRRQEEEKSKDLQEGFELLDLDDGAGWELLCSLMAYDPQNRPSAAEALQSNFLSSDADSLSPASAALASASRSVGSAIAGQRQLLDDAIMAGAKRGDLTEARLYEELGIEEEAPRATRMASNTIAWWQERKMLDAKKKQGSSKEKVAPTGTSMNSKGKQAVKQGAQANKVSPLKLGMGAFLNRGNRPQEEVEEVEEEEEAQPIKSSFLSNFLSIRK